jgi:hypothetical protein
LPIFWLSFRPRKPDCKLHKKLTQLGKGKKIWISQLKTHSVCCKNLGQTFTRKKSDKKMKIQDTKTMEWFAWTFDYELLCKKGIFCDFKIDGKVRRRTIEKVRLKSQRTGNRKSLGKFNQPSFSFFLPNLNPQFIFRLI